MELVNEASKPSFRSPKLTHRTPPHSDQFWTVSGDEFSIKDLLDFSTDPVETLNEDKTTILNTEFSFPAYDIDDLEWVSQFVNDSFSGDSSLTCPVRKFPERKTETETETVTLVAVNPLFKNLVHKKARSKRRRTGGSVWSLRSSSPMTDSSTSSSSNSSCTSRPLLFAEENLGKPEKRKRPAGTGQLPARRCSHCLVQKTPQWRAGPLGAKTLCNACGVRFKSGRLLPEYRPACSPTFSSDVHSNSHRKVLEMRQKKAEAAGGGGGGLAVRSS